MVTVRELRKILRGLPPDMKVVIGVDESLEDICAANLGVVSVKFDDTNEKESLMVLPVCECDTEEAPEPGEINGQPELN